VKVIIGYLDVSETYTTMVNGVELQGYFDEVAELSISSLDNALEIARDKYDMTYGTMITEDRNIYDFNLDINTGKLKRC